MKRCSAMALVQRGIIVGLVAQVVLFLYGVTKNHRGVSNHEMSEHSSNETVLSLPHRKRRSFVRQENHFSAGLSKSTQIVDDRHRTISANNVTLPRVHDPQRNQHHPPELIEGESGENEGQSVGDEVDLNLFVLENGKYRLARKDRADGWIGVAADKPDMDDDDDDDVAQRQMP